MVCQNEKEKKISPALVVSASVEWSKGALVRAAWDCVCGPKYQQACMDDVVAIRLKKIDVKVACTK